MKVSTGYYFDRSTQQIGVAQQQLAKTQSQLSTGRQVAAPSDAPDQALAIDRLRNALQRQDQLASELRTVQNRYGAAETALRSAGDILIRVKELSLQGASDTMGPQDRQAIAVEMQALRDQLVVLANSQDDAGQYLFGGTRVRQAPFVSTPEGRIVYEGDQTPAPMSLGEVRGPSYNRPGSDMFPRVIRQVEVNGEWQPQGVAFFDVLDDNIAALQSGDQTRMAQGMNEVTQLLDAHSLSLADLGAAQNRLEVQQQVMDEAVLRMKTTLSDLQDLDYAEAVARMNKQMLSLEAAMSSFGKVSQLQLFNFIGR